MTKAGTPKSVPGKKKKRKRKKLSAEARAALRQELRFMSDIRTTFTNSAFKHIATRNTSIEVAGRRSELDSVFLYKNVVVILEDTMSGNQRELKEHLRKKAEFWRHVQDNADDFLKVMLSTFGAFRSITNKDPEFDPDNCILLYVYCSRHDVPSDYRQRYKDVIFLDYALLRYFLTLARTIRKSARYELLKFLNIELNQIGIYSPKDEFLEYKGLLMPFAPAGFPPDYTLVSFHADPDTLMRQAYVLRTDSWRDSECLYQRLLIKNKITEMRRYLASQERVFVNNIIATLTSDSEIRNVDNKPLTKSEAKEIRPITIRIPKRFNSIGIIDGQHRLFAYHEGLDDFDKKIGVLRKKQHLLVTGIVYPSSTSTDKDQGFEAQLFLEINDKQKRVKGDLKQAIEMIVDPWSDVAIAKAVINSLANRGALSGMLEVHFYDVGKIKTTSIVSYGLRHIVNLERDHSFYQVWTNSQKNSIRRSKRILALYIAYCSSEINKLLMAFKDAVPEALWTADRKISRALSTTTINGLVYCLRLLIENNKLDSTANYSKALKKRMKVNFNAGKFQYRSSHWKALGEKLYRDCF